MNKTESALRMALEALEKALRYHGIMLLSDPPQDAWKYHRVEQTADEAITAIKEALAQPEQEPVAWMVTSELQDGTKNTYPLTGRFKDVKDVCDFGNPIPLYITPPQRKPLTDEMVRQCKFSCDTYEMRGAFVDGWTSAEQAHGIKE